MNVETLLFECFLKLSVDFDCTIYDIWLCFILDSISFRTFTYIMLVCPIVILTTCSPFLFYFMLKYTATYILHFELYFIAIILFFIYWFLLFSKLKRQLLVISIWVYYTWTFKMFWSRATRATVIIVWMFLKFSWSDIMLIFMGRLSFGHQ